MLTTIIAVSVIIFFTLVIAVGTFSLIGLNKLGLLKGFMQGKWLASLLTSVLMILFFVSAIGLLVGTTWASPLMTYTIYVWLVYVWLYNLNIILGMLTLLKTEKPRSISHFMGRSEFFDNLIEKSIDLSNTSSGMEETEDGAHAVSDSPLEEMLNDENTFPELFQIGIRRKMKRKLIGLIVHTVILFIILVFIR